MSEAAFNTGVWQSPDGLTLYYRDYPGPQDKPPILCIPGLTRNARDFEPIADAFAGEWRVICVDLRGRGQSDYAKDTDSYIPTQYVADLCALLDQEEWGKVVAVGTSLGGILAMMLENQRPGLLAGAVLNDIGPVIEPAGLERIRDYVGQGRSYPTWMHAARAMREQAGEAHPDFQIEDWLRMSKRLMCVSGNGRITFDYDMKIADPFSDDGAEAPADMWPLFKALDKCPVLALRGGLSDILSTATLQRMQSEIPDMETLTVPRVGHAPTLEENDVQHAIARLLGKVCR
ncbi:alpha/beta fold hydrolase [Altericroceibacterium endophyticum]|uniref:Alpha/beta fold hydrolase n=1 Tax=Altericroceibacterium endophyticum TaxID=1808508 RepID=A0A6I4T9Q0_9SPHN|nr:alpha/beta hydrolase [Altericroceibacterium endophyticum]MXO66891.1 alpha/beta fold hydrolase [Altericroceibacterium endophyticum]